MGPPHRCGLHRSACSSSLAHSEASFFYGETHARRRPIAERAHRAICSELGCAGTIPLILDAAGPRFLLPNDVPPIEATGALLDFEKALRRHGVKQLRLDPLLTETALAGLFDLPAQGGGRYLSPDGTCRDER